MPKVIVAPTDNGAARMILDDSAKCIDQRSRIACQRVRKIPPQSRHRIKIDPMRRPIFRKDNRSGREHALRPKPNTVDSVEIVRAQLTEESANILRGDRM